MARIEQEHDGRDVDVLSEAGPGGAGVWTDAEFVQGWIRGDRGDLLELPRRIAAAVVAQERPTATTVIDVGSGPGGFLAAFLDRLPSARGIWLDVSGPMLGEARKRLSRFGHRVEFRLGDMRDLAVIGLPDGVDVVITSRAAHHLDRDQLHEFYSSASRLLAPGGWLVNLDHIGPGVEWDRRLRAVRPQFVPSSHDGPTHHHDYPLASAEDHLAGFASAGIEDAEVVWRAFYTCLFMGRVAPGGETSEEEVR